MSDLRYGQLPNDREGVGVLWLERDRFERWIQRQQLNAVVPPAVGGHGQICR